MTPADFHLRNAIVSDLDAILALERATDNAPHWSLATYSAILDDIATKRCLIVAETDETLAGFAVGLVHQSDSSLADCIAELESVVVAETFRRAGIGRALCSSILKWCQSKGATEVELEVRAASIGAIALYLGLGFTQTRRRPRYYRDPEDDALIMRLRLDSRSW